MKKSGFLLFLVISLSLTAFLAGYIMIGKGTSIIPKTGTILDKFGGTQPTTTNPQSVDKTKPLLVTDKRIVSVTNSTNKGSVLYFEKNTGKLYEYDISAKVEKTISDKMLPNFISALWSPNKKEFLGYFTSSGGMMIKYMNVDTGKEVALNSNIRSAAFSPDGNLIAYYYLDDTTNDKSGNITISQPDGQYQKKVLATRINELLMSWPNKDTMAFKTPSQEIFLLTEDGKLTKFLDTKPGLEEKWSPSGNKLLFSALSDEPNASDIKLWIKDVVSKEEKELVSGFASKCVWSIDSINIYCAIPKSPSADELYLINSADGSNKLFAEPNMPVKELFLSTIEDHLLFINMADEKLYSIKISD